MGPLDFVELFRELWVRDIGFLQCSFLLCYNAIAAALFRIIENEKRRYIFTGGIYCHNPKF